MQILTIKYVAMTVASLAFLMGCSPNQHDSVSLDSESEAAKPQSIAKFKAYTKRFDGEINVSENHATDRMSTIDSDRSGINVSITWNATSIILA